MCSKITDWVRVFFFKNGTNSIEIGIVGGLFRQTHRDNCTLLGVKVFYHLLVVVDGDRIISLCLRMKVQIFRCAAF